MRTRGAKCVPKQRCKTIYDIYCIDVRVKDIAEYCCMKQPTVSNIFRRLRTINMKPVQKKMGRKPKLSERGMRLLRRYILDNKFEPLYTIAARFNDSIGLNLLARTVRRYMRKLKMNWYIAVQKPYLSTKNIAARILWARTHEEWTHTRWSNVLFTDESSFTVRPVKNRLRVWRTKRIEKGNCAAYTILCLLHHSLPKTSKW